MRLADVFSDRGEKQKIIKNDTKNFGLRNWLN